MKFVDGRQLLLTIWLCCGLLPSVHSAQAQPAKQIAFDSTVMSDIIGLLNDLGYVPGTSVSRWETYTETALSLFLKTENPVELSSMKGRYEENLDKFRDALRKVKERQNRALTEATIFVETPHADSVTFAVNPAGTRVLSSDGTTLKGWNAHTGRQLWSTTAPSLVADSAFKIAISDDGNHAVSFGNAIRVYNAKSGAIERSFWTRRIDTDGSVAIAANVGPRANTTELVVGEIAGMAVTIYDWNTGRFVAEMGRHENGFYQDGNIRRSWNQPSIRSLVVSPDGRYAASAAYDFGVRVWDLERRRQHRFLQAPSGIKFDKLIFYNGGRTIAAVVDSLSFNKSYANTVFFFDIDSGVLTSQRFKGSVYRISAAAEDKTLFVNGEIGTSDGVHVFDGQGHLVRTIPKARFYGKIAGDNIVFNFDGGRLTAQTLDRAKLWTTAETSLGFDGIVVKNSGQSLQLQGRSGEILDFDLISGSLGKTAQLLDDKGETVSVDPLFGGGNRLVGRKSDDDYKIEGWVLSQNGKLLCRFQSKLPKSDKAYEVSSTDYASARNLVAQLIGETVYLFDASTCKERLRFRLDYATGTRANLDESLGKLFKTLATGVRFSADGSTLYAWRAEDAVQAFDVQTGKRSTVYRISFDNGNATPEFASTIAEAKSNRMLPLAWDVRPIPNSKRFAVTTGRTYYQKNGYVGLVFIFEEGNPRWLTGYNLKERPDPWAIDSPGTRMFAKLGVFGVSSVDLVTGRVLTGLGSEPGEVITVASSPDGRLAIVLAKDGVLRVYDSANGDLLITTAALSDGTWLSITPEGFFASSPGGENLVSIKRAGESYGIEQFYQSLYRPDLVREKLAGDPRGLVREAAAQLDLNKVVASGNAPDVKAILPAGGPSVANGLIRAEAEITDRGGGIGRVEWRLNGVTVGIETPPAPPAAGQPLRLSRNLALSTEDKTIEVVAYNSANLVASVPARIAVAAQVPAQVATDKGPQRLFVLAAGLDNYADQRFKLQYSVPDAKAMAQALTESGKGLYSTVEVKLMSDTDVTSSRLESAFQHLSKTVQPTDVFVLYLAGHGKTVDGRYYFVPQTFKIDGELTKASINAAVIAQGISQEKWQRWLALIPARKSMILFDTCESGTLTGDEGLTKVLEQGAANDRLAQATGRSIITASSGSTEAFEGYRGHGLFTYNLLDALERGDGDNNGTIEVSELAAYVYAQVSSTSERVFKQRQEPQIKINLNYPLTKQTRVLQDSTPLIAMDTRPTFQLTQEAQLQIKPTSGATIVRSLSPKTAVTVLKSENGWSLIASGGRPVGYVATRDLAPIQ
ncbi:MAG: caspase family protein [Afipia sp.]|nr:caspase family protein [Afipia sp.]